MKKNFLMQTIALAGVVTLALSGCTDDAGSATENSAATGDPLRVTTAFYPISYLVSEIGGDKVAITDLTPPGADAHGVELSPRAIADMQESDLVVYIEKLAPAIDDAVASANLENSLNLAEHVNLLEAEKLTAETAEGADHSGHDHDHADHDEHEGHADDAHGAEEHADEHAGHDHGIYDPHFWTDPGRMALAAPAVAKALGEADPDNVSEYTQNAEALAQDLETLANSFHETLAEGNCATTSFVVTHQAFGYLAYENHLTQVGIAGIDPDLEPSPARIAEVKQIVDEHKVNTIFTTNEGEMKVAKTVAAETGTEAKILDSAATQLNADKDYQEVMKENLTALSTAMGCQAK